MLTGGTDSITHMITSQQFINWTYFRFTFQEPILLNIYYRMVKLAVYQIYHITFWDLKKFILHKDPFEQMHWVQYVCKCVKFEFLHKIIHQSLYEVDFYLTRLTPSGIVKHLGRQIKKVTVYLHCVPCLHCVVCAATNCLLSLITALVWIPRKVPLVSSNAYKWLMNNLAMADSVENRNFSRKLSPQIAALSIAEISGGPLISLSSGQLVRKSPVTWD